MINWSYSQIISTNNNKYPKYTIINFDTLVLITKPQMININLMYNELEKEKALNLNLNQQLNINNNIIEDYKIIKQESDSLIIKQNKRLEIQKNIIKSQNNKISNYKKYNKYLIISNGVFILTLVIILSL